MKRWTAVSRIASGIIIGIAVGICGYTFDRSALVLLLDGAALVALNPNRK